MLNRKLRVLMLSLFAVMFAVSSAFAFLANDLTITLNDGSDTAKSFADYTGGVALPRRRKLLRVFLCGSGEIVYV